MVLVEGSSMPEVINRANICVAIVGGEIKRLGLGISPHKTEIVAFGAPPGAPGVVRVDGVLIPIGSAVRYLGLDLDAEWTFRGHFDRLLSRADRMVAASTRIMPNLGGPGGRRRQVYAGVVHSVIMYGAPVWAEVVARNRRLKQRIWAIQRRVTLCVISAYRTVSWDAAAILAGLVPSNILAECYRRTFYKLRRVKEVNPELTARARKEIRKRERKWALDEWLAALRDRSEEPSGRRVREALIPIFEEWIGDGRPHISSHAVGDWSQLIR